MSPQTWLIFTGVCLAAYLIGSVTFAIILSRIIARDDIRKHGSGSAGMTNMLRTYGKAPAIITAAGDFLKAFGAVYLARYMHGFMPDFPVDAGYLAGIFVIIGHLFPLYFRFKGGKGVLCALGTMAAVSPVIFAMVLIAAVPLIFITRTISTASISGAIFFIMLGFAWPFWLAIAFPLYYSICSAVIGAIIVASHHANIKRLRAGTENRLGRKKP